MNLIGVAGRAGAGKDTAADWLVKSHGYTKVSFADPLKRFAMEVYDFSEDQLWGPSSSRNRPDTRYIREVHERHDWAQKDGEWKCIRCEVHGDLNPDQCTVYLTPRFALQVLGTEWGRTCYTNTWVDLAIRHAHKVLDEGYHYHHIRGIYQDSSRPAAKGVVISDVRFQNEIKGIRDAGGTLWRVKPAVPKGGGEAWRTHKSEAEMDGISDSAFDQIIINHKVAFETLYASVDGALLAGKR